MRSYNKTCVMDTESTTSAYATDRTQVYIIGIKSEDFFEGFLTGDEFFNFVKEKGIRKIYCHNLSHEAEFMLHYLTEKKYRFQPNRLAKLEINDGRGCESGDGSAYELKIKLGENDCVNFRCSIKLLGASVEALGSLLYKPSEDGKPEYRHSILDKYGFDKISKGEIDYDAYKPFESREEAAMDVKLIDYLHRDCAIPLMHLDILQERIKTEKRLKSMPLTRASYAYKDFMASYEGPKEDFEIDIEDWRYAHDSYFGGFTMFGNGCAGVKIEKQGCFSYDINSSYPASMCQKMPYGKSRQLCKDEEKEQEEIVLEKILYSNVELKDEYPAMIPLARGFRDGQSYKRSIGNEAEEYTLGSDEAALLESCMKPGFKKIVVERRAWKTKLIFKDWIMDLYNKRLAAKAAGDTVNTEGYKLMMNSCYGKFGMNYAREVRVLTNGTEEESYKGQSRYGEHDEFICESVLEENTEDLKYMPIASRICSLSRMNLMNGMIKNIDRFLYCDTDSLYLSDKAVDGSIHIDNKILGAGKKEHEFDIFKVLRAKLYMYHDSENDELIIKSGGLPKSAHNELIKKTIDETFDEFKRYTKLTKVKLQKRRVKGGIILVETDFEL